jgi:hypothetical protein
MMSSPDLRRIVYGVDFSGAKDAGKKIWIARGIIKENFLQITECFQAKDLPGSGGERERSLISLREFIRKQKDSIVGLDFPFGIPKALVEEESWKKFVLSFKNTYISPWEFRKDCKLAAAGKELKRFTDVEAKTPFSPYNLRLFRQTYFGIRDVLGPLIRNNEVCVQPMQKPLPDRAWILEICPASTLKRENLRTSYKKRGERYRNAKKGILKGIEKAGVQIIKESGLRSIILNNQGGDALDSIIAAFATFRALQKGFIFDKNSPYALEGWIYW